MADPVDEAAERLYGLLLDEFTSARNAAAKELRDRGLTGRRRFERALAGLEAARDRIPATFEVIYGHAWKAAPRRTPEGHAIVTFER